MLSIRYSLITLMLLSCSACHAAEEDVRTLNYFVAQKQSRPFQIEQGDDQHRGVVTDLLQEIATRLGLDIRFHVLPYKRYRQEMISGSTSHWITYGAPNWAPPQSGRLGKESIMTVSHSALSLASEPAPPLQRAEDLCHYNVVLMDGFYYVELDELLNNGCITAYRVRSHRAACLFVDRNDPPALFVEMTYRIRYTLMEEQWPAQHFRLTDISAIIPPYDIFFSYSADIPDALIRAIDAEIHAMKASGELQRILATYQHPSG